MKSLDILYLEDSVQDAEMTTRVLSRAGIPFTLRLVDNAEQYQQELIGPPPDLILSDHSLYNFDSLEALNIYKGFNLKIPFILVTGTVSEEFAVTILKMGATDYLLKGNLARLPNAILNAVEKFRIEREKEQYMERIMFNEKLLKHAEKLAQFGSWVHDFQTGTTVWSDEIFRIYGFEPCEIEASYEMFLSIIHPEDRPFVIKELETTLWISDFVEIEFRIIDRHNIVKYIHAKVTVQRDSENIVMNLMGFNHDITARKESEMKFLKTVTEMAELEKELVEQKLGLQRIITEVTIQAQEKERNELAKELHDNINQILATVQIYLNLASVDEALRNELVFRSLDTVKYAVEEIRKLSKSLSPPSLDDMTLMDVLQDLVEELNLAGRPKIILKFKNLRTEKLDPNVELMLYRIVQEQMTNINKYADAEEASIILNISQHNIYLSITDNGIGFDSSTNIKGIGLKNIKGRVGFYSGKVNIITALGKGCNVEINIPI